MMVNNGQQIVFAPSGDLTQLDNPPAIQMDGLASKGVGPIFRPAMLDYKRVNNQDMRAIFGYHWLVWTMTSI